MERQKEMSEQRYLILDYETRSEADLRKVGAYEYAAHPSTRILCAAWRVGTRAELKTAKIETWSPAFEPRPTRLVNALGEPYLKKVAHNAFFEQVITSEVLNFRFCPPSEWVCTSALAATHALPRSLEGACAAFGFDHQKDMDGHRLMMKMSKPRKPSKHNPAKWFAKKTDLKRLIEYCVRDIEAETELFLTLPPLSPTERALWVLDQEINLRGFHVDLRLVDAAMSLRDREFGELQKELRELTGERVRSSQQVAVLVNWLSSNGCQIPDLKAKSVVDMLKTTIPGNARRALEIRQDASKSSTKKYAAFADRTSPDDWRLRGSLVYHGASTGRWTGSGVQPQNFPRGMNGVDTDRLAEVVLTGDLEMIRLLYGSPMEVLASTLRSCIVAEPGKRLVGGDFNAIELRVLFWVAGHEAGLRAITENRQMYREMAEEIYGKKIKKDEGPEREVGKRAILGCGYGMGAKKFFATCEQFGQTIDLDLAKRAVDAYRSLHNPVPALWGNLEKAAVYATENKGKKITINKTKWSFEGRYLYCELPSGRRLAYIDPSVRYEETPWGERRPKLYHYGVNPRTRAWENSATWGGVLTENVIQATARDLMACAMMRVEGAGYRVVLTVHDEILTERGEDEGSVEEFEHLMAELPSWAAGCPVKVKGFEGPRYKK